MRDEHVCVLMGKILRRQDGGRAPGPEAPEGQARGRTGSWKAHGWGASHVLMLAVFLCRVGGGWGDEVASLGQAPARGFSHEFPWDGCVATGLSRER